MRSQPAEPREGFATVGRVLGVWGLRGDLKIEPLSDFPQRFDPGRWLWLCGVQREIMQSRWQRGSVILRLTGIDSPEAGQGLRGALVEVPESDLFPLAEDEYYEHDLIGLRVCTRRGEQIGCISRLVPTGANDVVEVVGDAGVYLLPLIADVVDAIDLLAGEMRVDLIEGLEPLPAPKPRAPRAPRRPAAS